MSGARLELLVSDLEGSPSGLGRDELELLAACRVALKSDRALANSLMFGGPFAEERRVTTEATKMEIGKLLVEIATTKDLIRRCDVALDLESVEWKRESLLECKADAEAALENYREIRRAHTARDLAELEVSS